MAAPKLTAGLYDIKELGMPEKRMLIVPAELVRKIDENRGGHASGRVH
jgi:hypothetical protein